MRKQKLLVGLLALVLVLSFAGCGVKNVSAPHPNQLSDFDGKMYDSLLVAQGSLDQAKKEVVNYPQYKGLFNEAASAYNLAKASYATYHSTGKGDTTLLQEQLNDVVAKIAQVQKAFGAKP